MPAVSFLEQYDDQNRLPEGVRRIGYDADTEVYIFEDKDGEPLYGPPGETYGVLSRTMKGRSTRANAFDDGRPRVIRQGSTTTTSFSDFLPAASIKAAAPASTTTTTKSSPPSPTHPASRKMFASAVKRAVTMRSVVKSIRRSDKSQPVPPRPEIKLINVHHPSAAAAAEASSLRPPPVPSRSPSVASSLRVPDAASPLSRNGSYQSMTAASPRLGQPSLPSSPRRNRF